MCHQMAMKKEANDKKENQELRKSLIGIGVPIIWILGGPGCGKGTQCARIVEEYSFVHLSSGDLLREEVASGSQKGRQLEIVMKEGTLVPNEEVLSLLEQAINRNLNNTRGFLIDGYPREKDQGVAFERKIGPADLIIYFDCSDETMVKRILGRAAGASEQRADDNEKTIKTRLATFRNNTNAILSQYAEKTLVINAERNVDDIYCEVDCAINCLLKKKYETMEAAI